MLVLILASGLRGEDVGIDTTSYYFNFRNDFPYSWIFEEVGFRATSRFLLNVFDNPTILFVIYAAVINILIIARLWSFKEKCSFTYMMFIYLTIYYLPTMNVMRQFVAVAIVFYATKYLDKNRFIIFFGLLLIAISIHQSALLGMLFFIIYVWNYLYEKKSRRILLIPLVLLVILGSSFILRYESNNIDNYLSSGSTDISIIYFYKIICLILVLLFEKKHILIVFGSRHRSEKQSIKNEIITLKDKSTIYYIMGIGTSMLSMFFTYMNRLGFYYLMYEMVFWGRAVKNNKNKNAYMFISAVFCIYTFAAELLRNGSGIFPYYLQWMEFFL